MTLQEFITKHRIMMTVDDAGYNPNCEDWTFGVRHYRCRLRGNMNGRMQIHYSMGPMCKRPPTVNDVMECLRDDAHLLNSGEASSIGVSERPLRKQTDRLTRWLGDDRLAELLTTED